MSIEEAIERLRQAGLDARYIGEKYPNDYADRMMMLFGGSSIVEDKVNEKTHANAESPEFDIWVEGKLWIVRIEDMGTPGDSWIYRHFPTLEDCINFICKLQHHWST